MKILKEQGKEKESSLVLFRLTTPNGEYGESVSINARQKQNMCSYGRSLKRRPWCCTALCEQAPVTLRDWVTLSVWQQALAQPPHTVPAVCSNNARSPKTAISANSKGTAKASLLGAVNVWLPSAWMCEAWRKIIKLIWQSLWDRIWDEYAANTLFWFNDVLEESACISQSSHIAVSKRCISRDDVTMSAGDSNPDPWKSWGQGSIPANSFTAGKV